MHLRVDIDDGCIICRPVGTLDAYTAPRLREAMALMGTAQSLVIDLSEVPFVDSAALAALINGIRRVREGGGDVAVCSTRRNVRRVLETIGFERVVPMVETIDEARRIMTARTTPLVTVA